MINLCKIFAKMYDFVTKLCDWLYYFAVTIISNIHGSNIIKCDKMQMKGSIITWDEKNWVIITKKSIICDMFIWKIQCLCNEIRNLNLIQNFKIFCYVWMPCVTFI